MEIAGGSRELLDEGGVPAGPDSQRVNPPAVTGVSRQKLGAVKYCTIAPTITKNK